MEEKEIFDYAKNLILCGELDYSSAKILYDAQKKPFAVILYHIQQSVEKLAKAELILRKQLDPDELKKVNHKTPNAFMISLDKARQNQNIKDFLSPYIDETTLSKAKGYIKDPSEIILSNKETLLKMLNFYDEVFKPLGLTEMMFQQALSSPIEELVKRNSEERADAYMRLFFLSWITFFFAEETRYPDGKIKPFEYTEDNPFVQIIPDLLNKIEKILFFMKSYQYQ